MNKSHEVVKTFEQMGTPPEAPATPILERPQEGLARTSLLSQHL